MRTLLVHGDKTFKIDIPDDAKVTFGPWSPPNQKSGYSPDSYKAVGTLRIYKGDGKKEESIIACFSGVGSFRDVTMGYAEQVAKEEGATIWKDDEKGYVREHKVSVQKEWVALLPEVATGSKKARKS
jgi:hypothetical protein